MHFAIHGTEVKVPDFHGLTISAASHRALDYGLNLSVDNRFYSTDVPADYVLTQSPAAGTVVRREWHVRITQSLGPQRVPIPNAVGLQERVAALEIRKLGLDVGTVAHLPSPVAAPGIVIAQNPPPNAGGVERPNVSLLLADPPLPAEGGYVMPDFIGQQESTASATIFRAGLKLGPTKTAVLGINSAAGSADSPGQEQSPPGQPATVATPTDSAGTSQADAKLVPPGTVVAQVPAPGHRVDFGTVIEFTVAE
jgi:beta-lactam-binding protein with PASTA domain